MNGSKPEYVDCIVTEGAEIVYVGKNLPSVYINSLSLLYPLILPYLVSARIVDQAPEVKWNRFLNLDLRLRIWMDDVSCLVS